MQNLHGLVVCGGQSSRMGQDKSLIEYHGKPQWLYLYEMLKLLCKDVSVSCSKHQIPNFIPPPPLLPDDSEFENAGPMAALLTAFLKFPEDSFLVIGCDYPFVTSRDIQQLIDARREKMSAVCFYLQAEEPLLAIYEADIQSVIRKHFSNSDFSLLNVLRKSRIHKITPTSETTITSVDTPHAKKLALIALQNKSNQAGHFHTP